MYFPKRILFFGFVAGFHWRIANAQTAILIDHTCTDVSKIPSSWIMEAKSKLRIGYSHTSHGSQLVTGLEALRGESGSLYDYTVSNWGLVSGLF